MSKAVLTIGGGSGQFVLLSALRDLSGLSLSAVVSMTDSGGSTGRLRDELGILPPGDILKCVLALSPHREMARDLLLKRFSKGVLAGHNAGNMLLSMLGQYSASFPEGVQALGEMLDICGEVLPVTIDKSTLVAALTNGELIYGESAIDVPRGDQREKIEKVFLVPHHSDSVKVYPPVLERINSAEFLIIGPGDLYTSIISNLTVPGLCEAIATSKAKLVLVSSLMTKYGETDGFCLEDFIATVEGCLGRALDCIVFNTHRPSDAQLQGYECQRAKVVEVKDMAALKNRYEFIGADLIEEGSGVIRHDIVKLSKVMAELVGVCTQ